MKQTEDLNERCEFLEENFIRLKASELSMTRDNLAYHKQVTRLHSTKDTLEVQI